MSFSAASDVFRVAEDDFVGKMKKNSKNVVVFFASQTGTGLQLICFLWAMVGSSVALEKIQPTFFDLRHIIPKML